MHLAKLTRIVNSHLKIVNFRMLTKMNKKKFISLKSNYLKMRREELGSSCTCLRKKNVNTYWNSRGLGMKSNPSIVEYTEAKLLRY